MFYRQKYIWQSYFSRVKKCLFGIGVTIPRQNLSSFADILYRRLSVFEAADSGLGLWFFPASAACCVFDASAG
jgi:hypothetical protein